MNNKRTEARRKKDPLVNFKIGEILTVADVYTLFMIALYSVFLIIFYQSTKDVTDYLFLNALIAFWIISIGTINSKYEAGRLFLLFQRLAIVPIIFYIYMLTHIILPKMNPKILDGFFIQLDQYIFGFNPTEWIYQFSSPVLTEILQIFYWLFFFLIFINGIELHINKKDRQFRDFASMIMFSFYLTYILYIIFPVIGPRFTLHDFFMLDQELPGLFFTELIREQINAGAGLTGTEADPAAIVNRDCMPSGHTALSIINTFLAFKFSTRFRWFILIVSIGIIFSTIYLRYHYAIDVIAGIATALFILIFEPQLRAIIKKIKDKY